MTGFTQGVLAILVATFVYSLVVLRTVRSGDEEGAEFVPRVAVTLALLLAITSVGALVAFLQHIPP